MDHQSFQSNNDNQYLDLFGRQDVNLMSSEISSFKSYLDILDQYSRNKLNSVELAMMQDREYEDDEDKIIEITNQFLTHKDFRNILLSSFIISIYSYFESKLNIFCKRCEIELKQEISLSDLKDQGFVRAKKYLEKICCLNMPDEHFSEELLFLGRIRNYIAHNGGYLKDEDLLNQFDRKGLHYSDDGIENKFIIATIEYSDNSIKIIEEYLKQFLEKNSKIKAF